MLTKTAQEWISYAKPRKRYLFFYEEQVLDLTDFAAVHPGGKKALTNYIFKDITDILFSVYPHKKDHTLGVLQRYVIGLIPETLTARRLKTDKSLTKNPNNPSKEKKKVCFKKKFVACEEESDSQVCATANKGSKKEKSAKAGTKSSKAQQRKKPSLNKQDVSIQVLSEKALKQMEMEEDRRASQEKQRMRKDSDIDGGILGDEMDQKIGQIRLPFMNIHCNCTLKR